jgi:outer membrane protein
MRNIFAAVALLSAGVLSAADMKVGVVDVERVFQEFHKTKEASSVMKVNRDKVAQDMNERYSAFKAKVADVQAKQKVSQDPILTEDGKAKARAEYESLVKEVRFMEQEISEFQQRRSMQLRQEDMELQKGLFQEIVAAVQAKSKADGYDVVLDKSRGAANGVPTVLHHAGATDFTDEVIVELNKNAPAPGSKPEEGSEKPAAEEKPKGKAKK